MGRNDGGKKGRNRENTEDSLNSSDSEYTTEEDRRRSKVNLRHLEERLNMIQEECNRSDDESDDERSATIDDRCDEPIFVKNCQYLCFIFLFLKGVIGTNPWTHSMTQNFWKFGA